MCQNLQNSGLKRWIHIKDCSVISKQRENGTTQCEDRTIKWGKKNCSVISTITSNVGTIQCEDGTIKCGKIK